MCIEVINKLLPFQSGNDVFLTSNIPTSRLITIKQLLKQIADIALRSIAIHIYFLHDDSFFFLYFILIQF